MAKKEEDFEKKLERLQKIVESLEGGSVALEKGVALYKEGMGLARDCRSTLDKARHEVEIQNKSGLEAFRFVGADDPGEEVE